MGGKEEKKREGWREREVEGCGGGRGIGEDGGGKGECPCAMHTSLLVYYLHSNGFSSEKKELVLNSLTVQDEWVGFFIHVWCELGLFTVRP